MPTNTDPYIATLERRIADLERRGVGTEAVAPAPAVAAGPEMVAFAHRHEGGELRQWVQVGGQPAPRGYAALMERLNGGTGGKYLLDRGGAPRFLEPEADKVLGWSAQGEPVNLPIPARVTVLENIWGGQPYRMVGTVAELDAALAAGGDIILKPGTYDLPVYREIGVNGTRLIGMPGVVLRSTFNGLPGLDYNHVLFLNAHDVTIEGLEITSTKNLAAADGLTHYGVSFSAIAPSRVKIRRCKIHNLSLGISRIAGGGAPWSEDVLVEDCQIGDFTQYGILGDWNVRRWRLLRNRIAGRFNGGGYAANSCIDLEHGVEDVLIEGNECSHSSEILLEVAFDVDRVKIIGNTCRKGDPAGSSFGVSLGGCRNSLVAGNIVDDVRGIGIEVSESYGSPTPGQRAYVSVLGNVVRGVSAQPGLCTGISVDKIGAVLVEGNHIEGMAAAAGSYGVQVVNGSYEAMVLGNYLRKCGERFIFLNAAPRCRVAGNQLHWGTGDLDGAIAIYAIAGGSAIEDNEAYAPAGKVFGFANNGGVIQVGNGRRVTGTTDFKGSNRTWDDTGALRAFAEPTVTVGASHTVAAWEETVVVTGLTADATVTLPAASGQAGRRVVVKAGTLGGHILEVVVAGGGTIDGALNVSTTTNWAKWEFYCDGGQWLTV